MDREWHEAGDMRPSLVGLVVVLGVAALLRFCSLGGAAAPAFAPAEPEIITRVVRMMQTGDFNPRFFEHPSLCIYLHLAVACGRFVLGAGSAPWTSVSQITDADLYLWARIVTAILGVATVYLVYLIGARWGARHALLAAGLMAVLPNHVRASHFALTAVPVTFFTTLSFLLTLRALDKQTAGAYAWAGAAAGLAAGSDYYGALILVAPLLAARLARNPSRPPRVLALASLGGALGAFLLAAPYTVLDLPGFLDGIGAAATAARARPAGVGPAFSVFATEMKLAFWYSGLLLVAWGLVHAIVRAITGPGKARFVLLLVFPVACVGLLACNSRVTAEPLVPMLPFLALLMAIAIVSGVSLLRRFNIPRGLRTSLIVALTVVAILPPGLVAIGFDVSLARSNAATAVAAKKAVVRATAPMTAPAR
jgi:4-amino-4-deoxy-L-arabinose transferase-like glycosyltransferase